MTRFFSSILCLLLWLPLEAAVAADKTVGIAARPDPFSFASILNMILGLVVVVALILGLAWVLRKYGRLPVNQQVNMKILGGLSLGTRERAILVEVEGKRLLLGVSPGHVQTLHVMDDKQAFSGELQQAMEQTS